MQTGFTVKWLALSALMLTQPLSIAEEATQHPCQVVAGAAPSQVSRCEDYVLGFLEGALLTDAAIIRRVEQSEGSEFLDRVLKTKTLRYRSEVYPTYLAQFCIPPSISKPEVVTKVMGLLRADANRALVAGERVYNAFQSAYPCEETE